MDKYIFFTILLFLVFGWYAIQALNAEEHTDCYKWQQQAKNYEDFYLTKQDKAQCDRWNIKINAPIK